MAIRARVQLKGCASHVGRGKTVKKDQIFYTTNVADIAYYQSAGVFDVLITPNDQDKPFVQPEPISNLQRNQFEDVTPKSNEVIENNAGLVEEIYSKAGLHTIKKHEVIDIANDDFGLDVDDSMTKPQIVALILKAQIDAFSIE